jgi:hypothetical protein
MPPMPQYSTETVSYCGTVSCHSIILPSGATVIDAPNARLFHVQIRFKGTGTLCRPCRKARTQHDHTVESAAEHTLLSRP